MFWLVAAALGAVGAVAWWTHRSTTSKSSTSDSVAVNIRNLGDRLTPPRKDDDRKSLTGSQQQSQPGLIKVKDGPATEKVQEGSEKSEIYFTSSSEKTAMSVRNSDSDESQRYYSDNDPNIYSLVRQIEAHTRAQTKPPPHSSSSEHTSSFFDEEDPDSSAKIAHIYSMPLPEPSEEPLQQHSLDTSTDESTSDSERPRHKRRHRHDQSSSDSSGRPPKPRQRYDKKQNNSPNP